MKRIDMWITDKQSENIKNYIKNNEGQNKSKIIRDALDRFFEENDNENLLKTIKYVQTKEFRDKIKNNNK